MVAIMCSLRAVTIILLLLGIRGVGIAWALISDWQRFQQLGGVGAPAVRAGVMALLGVMLCWHAWGVWRRQAWAWRRSLPLLISYVVFDNLWWVFFAQSTFDRARLPFIGVTSLLLVGFYTGLWWRLRKLFGETNDQREETSDRKTA